MTWAAWLLGAYLAGSIPVGYLLAKSRGVDIRKLGSGNIGATNVGRVLGPGLGWVCLVLDMLKGLAPTLAAGLAWGSIERFASLSPAESGRWLAVAASAIAGHMFPVWLGFKGGKGVATGLGAILGVFPMLAVPSVGVLFVWVVAVKVTRYIGVSSCVAAASLPVWLVVGGLAARATGVFRDAPGGLFGVLWPFLTATIGLAALVIWRHRANLARTLAGNEHRIGERVTVGNSR